MKDSGREESDFSTQTRENEADVSEDDEVLVSEPKRTVHDHPFSIESILNGRTRRASPKVAKNSVSLKERREIEENTLPLNALEEFTSKAFSTMRPERLADQDEEPVIIRERLRIFTSTKAATTKKTRRKARTCFTNQQIYELERRFLYQKYLSPQDRDELSEMLNLSNAQVITWFQNRRAKLKRDIEEMRNDLAATRTLHASQPVCTDFHCRFTDCR
ncbi:transcription factor LBX1-like [Dendronephthya gigantea]|uniref:transcription factor LBX1-like n=1 Tax=Dendronephthya gigantea TaxID=151771 RepID=UPI00106B1CB8|nr:transcription factor LBX1-like [Dendronephthya gigantea]